MSAVARTTIGFDRTIDLEWLDAAAGYLAAGATELDTRRLLWCMLDGLVGGNAVNSARGKTLTVLMRIWVTVPQAAILLRNSALEPFPSAMRDERLALHWAMTVACYPFFFRRGHEYREAAFAERPSEPVTGDAAYDGDLGRSQRPSPRAVQRTMRSMI